MDVIAKQNEKLLDIIYGDVTLGIHGGNFHYIFSYVKGGLESLVLDGKEWLYRVPRPAFWRALTDNDRGSGFGQRSGMWLAADTFIKNKKIELFVDGIERKLPIAPENNRYTGKETAEKVQIIFTYKTITVPAAKVEVSYTVTGSGDIVVDVHYYGKKKLPELPVFGLRMILPTQAAGYRYEGLSGETYPDRMAGGIHGIYDVKGLPVTKYLVPQDCGVHMDTDWAEVYRDTVLDNSDRERRMTGLRFSGVNGKFAFSCLPFTPQELENATHQEELPPARRTVVSILGAVRGVGGIDSWGSDVEEKYRIDAEKDIRYSFRIARAEFEGI